MQSSEICNDKVVMETGRDVTEEYSLGAEKTLQILLENKCKKALLKENSPSCGTHSVYDGTFSKHLREGKGITASLLYANHISLFSEDEIGNLLS